MTIAQLLCIALLFAICSGIFGAASSTGILHLGTLPAEEEVYRNFILALRNNDARQVEQLVRAEPTMLELKFDGGITPLHIALAMEYVHGHDPKEIIDVLAQTTASIYHKKFIRESTLSKICQGFYDPAKNSTFQIFAHTKANVNHPIFHTLCTGESSGCHAGNCNDNYQGARIIFDETPLEFAARHGSVKTLRLWLHMYLYPQLYLHNLFLTNILNYIEYSLNMRKESITIMSLPHIHQYREA